MDVLDLILRKFQSEDLSPSEYYTLLSLLKGDWVDVNEVIKALGITFKQGVHMFEFSRVGEWWSLVGKTEEERARNGQKITTWFRYRKENID